MVRKQVLVTAEQNARLKSLASTTGRAEGELVREGIDKVLAEAGTTATASANDWRAGLMELRGMWADRTDLDDLFAERRMRRGKRRDEMMRRVREGRE
jgi:hypothetical protein